MNLDWIVSPLTQLTALAAGLSACLGLFISAKVDMAKLQRKLAVAPPPQDMAPLAGEIERLNEAVRALERTPPAPASGSMNLTRRTQIIRMHHLGEPVETISAALQVPAAEIELLLKLHRLTQADIRYAR